MNFLERLKHTIQEYSTHNAFFIKETYFKYEVLNHEIIKIRQALQTRMTAKDNYVGLVVHNDIHTYAAIIALWLEGKAYIPISPDAPAVRNTAILKSTDTTFVIDVAQTSVYEANFTVLNTSYLEFQDFQLQESTFNPDAIAYILFTSGSTGTPKGVSISFDNLEGLITAIKADKAHDIYPEDRCLQMFELTFDFSLVTFLYPLLHGACVYTIPKDQIKYLYVFKLIVQHKLTYLVMTPSIINYLQPYFNEIHAEAIRYCCFGAAPLLHDVLRKWENCIPNATVYNSYGPTEYTVTTSYYKLSGTTHLQTKNGVIAIGKPMQSIDAIIVDENHNEIPNNTPGELCLAGRQLTTGYWKNPEQNAKAFFEASHEHQTKRFYKTGDLCIKADSGVFIFIGRKDFQVKIQGYRIELGEIEFQARKIITDLNFTVLDVDLDTGDKTLLLVVESAIGFDDAPVLTHLKTTLPDYMVPKHTMCIAELPHNRNGKLDRGQLRTYFKNKSNG